MREITVEELEATPDLPIVDVREQEEWDAGHVPGAIHIPLGEVTERVAEFPDGVAIICHSGGRSARAAQYLEQQGIDALSVSGGTSAWLESGRGIVHDA